MRWQGVTTRLAPASKEEQRGQLVPGLLNGVHGEVTHGVSRVVVKQAWSHGLHQWQLSAQLPDLGSDDAGRESATSHPASRRDRCRLFSGRAPSHNAPSHHVCTESSSLSTLPCKPLAIVADDHPIFREGLVRIARQSLPSHDVIALSDYGQVQLLIQTQERPIDFYLLDLIFPGFDGANSVRELRREQATAPIVIVSMVNDHGLIDEIIEAGANAFISKAASPKRLSEAMDKVLAGEIVVVRDDEVFDSVSHHATDSTLSVRQMEILRFMRDGLTNKEIAKALDLSPFTVRAHVSTLLRHFDASTRTAAVVAANERGLL